MIRKTNKFYLLGLMAFLYIMNIYGAANATVSASIPNKSAWGYSDGTETEDVLRKVTQIIKVDTDRKKDVDTYDCKSAKKMGTLTGQKQREEDRVTCMGTQDYEQYVVAVVATTVHLNGAKFQPVQIQCALSKAAAGKIWQEHYPMKSDGGNHTYCKSGYSGTICESSQAPTWSQEMPRKPFSTETSCSYASEQGANIKQCDNVYKKPTVFSVANAANSALSFDGGATAHYIPKATQVNIMGFAAGGSQKVSKGSYDIMLTVTDVVDNGILVAPVKFKCENTYYSGHNRAYVSGATRVGTPTLLCNYGYKPSSDGKRCDAMTNNLRFSAPTPCPGYPEADFDSKQHAKYEGDSGCVAYRCLTANYAFESEKSKKCVPCSGTKNGPNPDNGVCVHCADKYAFSKDATSYCKPAERFTHDQLQYGKENDTRTKDIEKQCWALSSMPIPYRNCIMCGNDSEELNWCTKQNGTPATKSPADEGGN